MFGTHCSRRVKRTGARVLFSCRFRILLFGSYFETNVWTKERVDEKDRHEDPWDKSKMRGESEKFPHCFAAESHLKVKGASLKRTGLLWAHPPLTRNRDIRIALKIPSKSSLREFGLGIGLISLFQEVIV